MREVLSRADIAWKIPRLLVDITYGNRDIVIIVFIDGCNYSINERNRDRYHNNSVIDGGNYSNSERNRLMIVIM